MAEENVEGDVDWSGRHSLLFDVDTFFAMEGLQATLQQLEAELRQLEVSEESSTEYCNNFCQALMHYAGNRNSVEHGLPLLEVYCLSINCFAAARPHLTDISPNVGLVLKRLALSCLELLLSVPQNEIPLEAMLQFYGSVQAAHEAMLQYGSTDLHALLNITGEGGAWNNPIMVSLLTDQPTDTDKVNAYLALEGEDFMEMRIKHLEKVGEVEKALILNKACANCSLLPNQPTFRQTFVTQLCQQLPSEEAILEISRIDAKDILDVICNLDAEGDESTAFILCTTYFTQQLQQDSIYCSWELTLLWSKLQRRIDSSLESFIERCLQFGAIAKTIYHLFFLVRVIQTEAGVLGLAVSVDLCVKALRLPKQDNMDAKMMICKAVVCLLPEDLEVLRACQLTEFLLSPSKEAFDILEELYLRPDEKYDEEKAIIPNSLHCELLLCLKAHWPIDPEFWDWETLKRYCVQLLGMKVEEEVAEGSVHEEVCDLDTELNNAATNDELEVSRSTEHFQTKEKTREKHSTDKEASKTSRRHHEDTFFCQLCHKKVSQTLLSHHARKHREGNMWKCPVCLKKFKSKKEFEEHTKKHIQLPINDHCKKKKVKKKVDPSKDGLKEDSCDELEPGQIPLDPSLAKYYQSTHDPVVLEHILEQAASVPEKNNENDYITFEYINTYYKLQDRDVYLCPATDCQKSFKLFKYLGVHIKNDHDGKDANLKHYLKMKDSREKCNFCRKTFLTPYHHRQHRYVHYGDQPYVCLAKGCGARFYTTTELISHKHTHGYHLSYGCELKNCSFSYCDLGQLYHHEAQHFRDAAYTCTSPRCKKFYYSRKEFLQHLATHKITFTEKDFDAQRIAKRKAFLLSDESDSSSVSKVGADNGLQKAVANSLQLQTCVGVCFDGKKFTCGLKKCGRTFTTIRELQKHLRIAHPNTFSEEELLCKKKAQINQPKTQAMEVPRRNQESVPKYSSVETLGEEKTTKSRLDVGVALTSIIHGLHQLSLSNTSDSTQNACNLKTRSDKAKTKSRSENKELLSNSESPPTHDNVKVGLKDSDSEKELSERKPLKKAYTCEAKTCFYQTDTSCTLLQHYKKTHAYSDETLKQMQLFQSKPADPFKSKEGSVMDDDQLDGKFRMQSTVKPFVCEGQSCNFQSVTSSALMRHYVKIHDYTEKEVKEMALFQSQLFKPFQCHICSSNFRDKKGLVQHYLNIHHIKKNIVEQMRCTFKGNLVDQAPFLSSAEMKNRKKSPSFDTNGVKPPKCRNQIWKLVKDGKKGELKGKEKRKVHSVTHSKVKNLKSLQARFAAKGNKSYIVPRRNKIFHCVHKNCSAAFSNQNTLVGHLQKVHHYNRSQLCFPCEYKGCDKQYNYTSGLHRHYITEHNLSTNNKDSKLANMSKGSSKRRLALPEDPIPRFKCTFANCKESYHLKSSLLRHTSQFHLNENPQNPANSKYKTTPKTHGIHRHEYLSNSPVLRLQSTAKKGETNNGCQTKLIISSCSKKSPKQTLKQTLRSCSKDQEDASSDESVEETTEEALDTTSKLPQIRTEQKLNTELNIFRTHEEALQMCQDRCLPIAFPCMLQNCDSVVASMNSLTRHYLQIHKVAQKKLAELKEKLCFTAEQLEEIIQRKSALSANSDLARIPNGVLKMEYQSEPATPGVSSLTMSLHSIKTKSNGEEEVVCSGKLISDRHLLIEAEDLLYGSPKSSGHPEDTVFEGSSTHKDGLAAPPLVRPPPLDLSPPPSLRLTVVDQNESSGKDGKSIYSPPAVSISVQPLTRQPLRRKNEPSEPSAPLSPIPQDPATQTLAPRVFDIAAYKPLGFESSFLKFIQDKEEIKCESTWDASCLKPKQPQNQGCFRRKDSVKENSQIRTTISRSRKIQSSHLKQLISIQNLHLILKRALGGCGDQAIKQLQFLRPVVVLERPKSFASIFQFLPSETEA